jgi:hypothetical protein
MEVTLVVEDASKAEEVEEEEEISEPEEGKSQIFLIESLQGTLSLTSLCRFPRRPDASNEDWCRAEEAETG